MPSVFRPAFPAPGKHLRSFTARKPHSVFPFRWHSPVGCAYARPYTRLSCMRCRTGSPWPFVPGGTMYTAIVTGDGPSGMSCSAFISQTMELDVTGTCESAVQAILPRTPDIILSDACIARCCQAHCPFSRIILVSGYARFSYVCGALPAGVFKSIRRPLADSRSANGWDRRWQSLRIACIRMTDRTSHALHRCTFHPFLAPGQGHRCTVCASLLSAGDLLPTHRHDLYPVQADAARQQAQGNITPSCGFDRSSTPSRVFSQ